MRMWGETRAYGDLEAKHSFLIEDLGWTHKLLPFIFYGIKAERLVQIKTEAPVQGRLPMQAIYWRTRYPVLLGRGFSIRLTRQRSCTNNIAD